jgi:hypothetical protein
MARRQGGALASVLYLVTSLCQEVALDGLHYIVVPEPLEDSCGAEAAGQVQQGGGIWLCTTGSHLGVL